MWWLLLEEGRRRGGGGVERDSVRGLEVWMELELEMKLGYVGAKEREFGVSGRVCGVGMVAEGGRVGAIIWTRPGDERSSDSRRERWLAVPDALEVW